MGRSNAHIVLNSRDATQGSYNQLTFNAINQNIIQGNIERIGLNEVNFPYDIPNVQAGYNTFLIYSAGQEIPIEITPNFYNGGDLASAINAQIVAYGLTTDPVQVADNLPSFEYFDASNIFKFKAPVTPLIPTEYWYLQSTNVPGPVLPAPPPSPLKSNPLGKDLLLIMGFQQGQQTYVGNDPDSPSVPTSRFAAASAPLTFTQYIDVCSPQLCKFQYFRDGSTTNLSRRTDVICRIYITNNVALPDVAGSHPVVINRQFLNARMMKWTADNAVGTIDINLYDDCGQPLQTTWLPRNYQITFNCYEKDEMARDENGIQYYTPYKNQNELAWSNLSRQ